MEDVPVDFLLRCYAMLSSKSRELWYKFPAIAHNGEEFRRNKISVVMNLHVLDRGRLRYIVDATFGIRRTPIIYYSWEELRNLRVPAKFYSSFKIHIHNGMPTLDDSRFVNGDLQDPQLLKWLSYARFFPRCAFNDHRIRKGPHVDVLEKITDFNVWMTDIFEIRHPSQEDITVLKHQMRFSFLRNFSTDAHFLRDNEIVALFFNSESLVNWRVLGTEGDEVMGKELVRIFDMWNSRPRTDAVGKKRICTVGCHRRMS